MNVKRIHVALVLLVFFNCVLGASGPESLARFFNNVATFRADFEQVVLDENLDEIEQSRGEMWLSRPGKFRWDYASPLEQQIVSDGKQVWVYDVDLAQASRRRLADAIGTTPATLIAGLGNLESSFYVRDLGQQGTLFWVALTPKDANEGYEDIRVGFEDDQLRLLEFVDGLGQMTRITLSAVQENPDIEDKKFEFAPPPDVDVFDESE